MGKVNGVFLMIIGVSCLSCVDALMKFLTSAYSPFQIIMMRSLIALPVLLLIYTRKNRLSSLLNVNIKGQMIRNGFLILALILCIYSLSVLPLIEYSVLFFSSPILIALFSIPILKESVNRTVWVGVLGGFLGVIFALNPSVGLFKVEGLIALSAAFFYALGVVFTSKLSKQTPSLIMVIWFTGSCLIVGTIGTVFSYTPVQIADLPVFGGAAILNIAANLLITESFRRTKTSLTASINYSSIVWAGVIGYIIWGEVPQAHLLIGGVIIVGSGILVLFQDKKNRRREKSQIPGFKGESPVLSKN